MVRNLPSLLLCMLVISLAAIWANPIVFPAQAADPDCTNGDCPPPPPDCTNADCPPPPPDCTNADCPPDPGCTNADCPPGEPPTDCCCVGSNLPGTTRVCCCRSDDFDTVNCRESLVLSTDQPEFHSTTAEVSLEGFRPRRCDVLLQRFCDPPAEEVCTRRRGQRVCEKVVKRACVTLNRVCQYRFCGPDWFPYDEPAPVKTGCEWWDQIRECRQCIFR